MAAARAPVPTPSTFSLPYGREHAFTLTGAGLLHNLRGFCLKRKELGSPIRKGGQHVRSKLLAARAAARAPVPTASISVYSRLKDAFS